MDQTRKRSRERSDGEERGRRKKTATQTIKPVEDASTTEEEVEEFYAIVRRMQAAVKYFDKKDQNNPTNNLNNEGDNNQVRWRVQLESTLPVVVDDDVIKSGTNSDNNVVLDLNEVPVDETENSTQGI